MLEQGGARVRGGEVGRGEDQAVVRARVGGVAAELDGFARRLGAAAGDDGEGRVAGLVQGVARGAGD